MSDFTRHKRNRFARLLYYALDYCPGQSRWGKLPASVRTRYKKTAEIMMSSAFCLSDLDPIAARWIRLVDDSRGQ